jgi:hypothetical protein
MNILTEFMEAMPFLVRLSIAVVLWALSCILALNLAFGKDSLFMYKKLQYMIGEKAAVVVFNLGWILWPIGMTVMYISSVVIITDKARWVEIFKQCRKILLWIICIEMAIVSLIFLSTVL